jgi:hypothetical protein
MTRKSKGNKKKHKQKEVPKLLPPQSQPTVAKPSRPSPLLTVLGLLLTTLGLVALVELFPRLSAFPSPHQSIPTFTVSNDGYLKVTDVTSACFLWHVVTQNIVIESSMTQVISPPQRELAPTEGYTVPCEIPSIRPPPKFVHIDLAVVIYYRPWPFVMFRAHKLLRFVGSPGADLHSTIWDKQPSSDMERDFENWLTLNPDFPSPFGFK